MCECIKKIRWGKVLLVSLIYMVIAFLLHQAEALLTLKYYMMPEYLGVWSKTMMPTQGPPPLEFTLLSLLFAYLTGFVLAALFYFTCDCFEKSYWERVSGFTIFTSVLIFVIGYLPMILLFNIPLLLILSWFITSVLSVFLGTLFFARCLKK